MALFYCISLLYVVCMLLLKVINGQSVLFEPQEPAYVMENQSLTFTFTIITGLDKWRLTEFYVYDLVTPVIRLAPQSNNRQLCMLASPEPAVRYSYTCNASAGVMTLTIDPVIQSFDGNIVRCRSSLGSTGNDLIVKESRIIILDAPDRTPVITQSPPGAIISGDMVKLTCRVSGGNPLAVLSWNCSGNYNNDTSGNTASYSVEFNVDKSYNSRVCTCSGSHIIPSYRPTVHHGLKVYYAPDSNPNIQQYPSGNMFDGDDVKLTCSVSGGNPLAFLSWNCTGTSTNNTLDNTASYDIEFTVDKFDNGKICTCSASHPVTSYRPVVHTSLVVYYAPGTTPVITQSPQGSTINGKKVTLTCKVSGGNPLAVLSWNCSGNINNNTSGNTASYSVDFTVHKIDNNRICTCTGSHIVPSYRPTVDRRLVVYYAPDSNPIIQQFPLAYSFAGDDVKLTCSVSGGNPLALLSWNCTGTNTNNTLANTASYDIEFTVDKSDNGKTCTCSALHPVTSYKPIVHTILVVYYAPDTKPVIKQNPKGHHINGVKVTLTCSVSGGNPLAVLSWNCSGNDNNSTTGNTSSYTVDFNVDKTYNNKICTCSGSHIDKSYRPMVHHRLIVYYTPDMRPTIDQSPPKYVINGRNVTLKCNVSGGNPLATLIWNCTGNSVNSTTGNTALYSVEFTVNKDDNNKICTCSATHPITSYNQTIQLKLNVHYAPEVTVEGLSETYLEGDRVTLTCNATGNPSNYTYLGWTHTFRGLKIRTFNITGDMLILRSLSHQDIGNYSCSVSNDVPDLDGNPIQNNSRNIGVNFRPVFNGYSGITAKKGSNFTASANIFTFPDIDKKVKWTNGVGNILENDTHLAITFRAKPISFTFHTKVVWVEKYTYTTSLYFTNFDRHLAGLYTLMVNNSIGGANLTLVIVFSDIPVAPSGFSAKVVSSLMVTLSWIRGFNGGNPQIFTITYVKQNTNETLILTKNETKGEDKYEEDIRNLIPSTAYTFTISASNIEGPAHAINNTLIITTDDLQESDEISIAGPVGGAVGGTVLAVVTVIVVILFLRRYKGRDDDERKLKPVRKEDCDGDGLKDNILYESAGPHLNSAQGAAGVKYAVVQKGNKFSFKAENDSVQETALYTEVNKKFKPEQKGEIYANVSNKGKRTRKEKMKTNAREDVYENMENKISTQQTGNTNKDGLQYADLVFNPSKNGAKFVIHGLEDRTIYAEVDTTQKIDPLPDSDDENSVETKKQ